jgi:nucleotide-binding universal stress UspA family protein
MNCQVEIMKILVAVDATETSHQALEQALQLLNLQTATVLLLSVEPPVITTSTSELPGIFGESPEVAWQEQVEVMDLEKGRAQTTLTWAENICKQAGVQFVVSRMEVGDPKHVICEVAEQEASNLIVIGTHNKGMIERVFMGSVSDYVVHHSACPVLVVP